MGVEVRAAEVVRLAAFLPTTTVAPEELVDYIETGEVHLLPLMERAVRIAPSSRDEAVDLLAPLVAGLAEPEAREIVPALRWLTDIAEPGGDPTAWKAWFARRGAKTTPSRGLLDLPSSK